MGASQSSGETNINHRSSSSTYGALRDHLRVQYDDRNNNHGNNNDDQQEDISDGENDEDQQQQHISLLEKARMHRQYQQQQQDHQQANNSNKSRRKQSHSNLPSGLKTFVDAVHPSEFIAPSTTHTSDKKGKNKKHHKKDKKKKKSTDESDEDDDLLLFSSSAVKRNKKEQHQSTSAASPPDQGDTLTAEIYHLRSPNPSFVINNNNNNNMNNNKNNVDVALSSSNPQNSSNQNPEEDENKATTNHNSNDMINEQQQAQQAPSIYNQKRCYEPPRFAPPFLVDHVEAERYQVNSEFFDVLHTFGLTNSFSVNSSKKRQQQQQNLLVSSQQQALKKSPFRFFGEKGGCNHLLEQAVKRCGIKISSTSSNAVHGDTDNNNNNHDEDQENHNANTNNHEIHQQYPHSTSMFSPSIFAATGQQQQEQQHFGNQKPKDYQGAFLREFSSSTSSFSHRLFHNASHQGISSSSLSSCQKCPLCGMCSRHAEICTSTCQPHHYFTVNNNNSSSSSSSYKSTCFLEATPKFVSNVIHHQLPFSSSPASPSVSLAELHQQLLKLVLEQLQNNDNNNPFSSFFFPCSNSNHRNNNCDNDNGKNNHSSTTTMIDTIDRAHLIVAELLEASGISSILLSYLSCLEWMIMMASTASSSSSSGGFHFVSTSNVHFRLRKGSVIEFDRVSVELDGNNNTGEDSSSQILVSVKEVLFPSSFSTASLSDHWSTTLKRFVVVSGSNKNQKVTDITSRNFYRKMRNEFASSIVFSLLQMMLVNKSKMIC